MPLFPAVYGLARRAGLVERPWFQAVFPRMYFLYKRFVEDPFHGLAARRPELFRGGHVIDAGANFGYTALVFARAVEPGYRVYAFEPEAQNFRVMERMTRGAPVTAVRAALGGADGTVELWKNQQHHADHRVVTDAFRAPGATETVALRSIDSFVAGLPDRRVAFVKIDVQGYELPVALGMTETLRANTAITVAFEYAPEGLRELGFDPAGLVERFAGFELHLLRRDGSVEHAGAAQIEVAAARRGYVDIVAARRRLS